MNRFVHAGSDGLLCMVTNAEPLLTVTLTSKWYALYVWRSPRLIEPLTFDVLEDDASALGVLPYVDHVPNPLAVEKFAERVGYVLDELAFELLVGRWEVEVGDWRRK